jgi:quinol monooxygenase YgiN
MSQESIRVVAKVTARPEKAAELASILLALVAATRKEKGCVSYELLRSKTDAGDLVFVEEWTDDAALDAHFTMPHFLDALAKAKPLFAAEPDVRRYVVVK